MNTSDLLFRCSFLRFSCFRRLLTSPVNSPNQSSPLGSSWLLVSIALVSALHLSPVTNAHASDIYNCDGRWTNRTCDGTVVKTLEAADSKRNVLSPIAAQERSRKESLLHDLTMVSLRARREHDIRVIISPAQRICESDEHSLSECEAIVGELEGEISSRLRDAERLAIEKEKVAIKRGQSEPTVPTTRGDVTPEGYSESQTFIVTGRRWGRHSRRPRRSEPISRSISEPIVDERKILFRPNEVRGQHNPSESSPARTQRRSRSHQR